MILFVLITMNLISTYHYNYNIIITIVILIVIITWGASRHTYDYSK